MQPPPSLPQLGEERRSKQYYNCHYLPPIRGDRGGLTPHSSLAHTIDPRTGRPVQHSILSATVIADNCATADAYATAFMVLGLNEARQILNRHPELLAYLIYTDENGHYAVWASPELNSP